MWGRLAGQTCVAPPVLGLFSLGSQCSPFDFAQARRTGLTSVAPLALVWELARF
jgi:hypothetical protein